LKRDRQQPLQGLKPALLLVFCGATEEDGEKGPILKRDRQQPLQGLNRLRKMVWLLVATFEIHPSGVKQAAEEGLDSGVEVSGTFGRG